MYLLTKAILTAGLAAWLIGSAAPGLGAEVQPADWELNLSRQLRDFLLLEKYPGQEVRLSVSLRETPRVEKDLKKILGQSQVPADLSAKFFVSPKAKLEGNVVVLAEISWQGKLYQSLALPVRIGLKTEVLVASGKIAKGQVLTEKDFALKVVETAGLGRDVLRDPGLAVGRETKVPLYSGTLIAQWMIRERPNVHRGDTVTLVATCESVELKLPAVTQQDAYLGDKIKVKALSGKVLVGQLVRDSVVQVSLN